MSIYYIGLGSNVGNRLGHLTFALEAMKKQKSVKLLKTSHVYETPPWGNTAQPPFLNGVCALETALKPHALLAILQQIEQEGGRERHELWGPRTLDLDILYCADYHIEGDSKDDLSIPHPYFWDRSFVLLPLAEIEPNFIYEGESISQRLESLDTHGIEKKEKVL